MQSFPRPELLPMKLDGALTLRQAVAQDIEQLIEFNWRIHNDIRVGVWVSDLMRGNHPTFQKEDFLVVVDDASGKIVSSSNLISQTWTYGGIPFKVGRPELVGTDPDYRRRGLVRAQFDVLHAWSQQRGESLQAIAGIPYYYRQFGYEMALSLGGGRIGYEAHVPHLPEGQSEPYRIRPAQVEDLGFVSALYEEAGRRSLVYCLRDAAMWRYELDGQIDGGVNQALIRIIENDIGQPCGYLLHPPFLWEDSLAVIQYELLPGVSWRAVTPSVLRYIWTAGQQMTAETESKCQRFELHLGGSHPAYEVMGEQMPEIKPPYAWYIRIPDLAGFIQLIAPALEKRLAASNCCGYSGELHLSFYRSGLKLEFDQGRLRRVEDIAGDQKDAQAAFPGLTFYQLLLGYRSLDELRYAFPDCWVQKQQRALVEGLFPKKNTNLWPVH